MPKIIEAKSMPMEKATFHIFPDYGTPIVEPKDEESCIACMICEMVCPDAAIYIEKYRKAKAR